MKHFQLLFVCLILTLFAIGQMVDSSQATSKFFKRNDTLFLNKSMMPFNGYLNGRATKIFYQDGVASVDNPFSHSDKRAYWVQMIFLIEKDTFTIDTRYNINPATFASKKIFYLCSVGKSRVINIDTLTAINYSEIKILDPSFYKLCEMSITCPIENHRDNIIAYIYEKTNEYGMKLIKENKAIIKSFTGSGEGGEMYFCQRHNFDF